MKKQYKETIIEMPYSEFDARRHKISESEQATYKLKKKLLRDCGWTRKSESTPGALLMWHKHIIGKVIIADNIDAALALQDGLSAQKAEAK